MATGNGRNKVALKPGFSQMHWMMRVQSEPNLSGRDGRAPRRIPMSEVAMHATEEDAWTVFRGRVFNITPYLHYHPGGVEILMEGAGKDCTELFDRYHSWVNAEGMIGALYLGDRDDNAPNLRSPAKKPQVAKVYRPVSPAEPPPSPTPGPTANAEAKPAPAPTASTTAAAAASGPDSDDSDAVADEGWVDVADASALAADDSRLLVQVLVCRTLDCGMDFVRKCVQTEGLDVQNGKCTYKRGHSPLALKTKNKKEEEEEEKNRTKTRLVLPWSFVCCRWVPKGVGSPSCACLNRLARSVPRAAAALERWTRLATTWAGPSSSQTSRTFPSKLLLLLLLLLLPLLLLLLLLQWRASPRRSPRPPARRRRAA